MAAAHAIAESNRNTAPADDPVTVHLIYLLVPAIAALTAYRTSIYIPLQVILLQLVARPRKVPFMSSFKSRVKPLLLLSLVLAASRLWAQGPPYQTDDPVPVDLHHYEFYIFGGMDGTPAIITSTGPAFEFNWGAIPRVQLHAILPWGVVAPSNKPVYAPGGAGSQEFGLIDTELGAKIAFIKEGKHMPQVGSFTMIEAPTGNADKGLGVGKTWYKLPIWFQKNSGKWLFDGGGGLSACQAGWTA